MNKLILVTLLLCCGLGASAQKIRFTDSTNVWTVRSTHFEDPYGRDAKFTWGRDTVMNGLHYQYLGASNANYVPITNAWIREDSLAGKVYFIRLGISPARPGDSVERVLYDYNLLVGDTVRVDYGRLHTVHFVQGIDSTVINGVTHRVWHLQGVQNNGGDWSYPYLVVEGVGATRHPLFPGYPSVFENGETMYCFRQLGRNPVPVPVVKWQSLTFSNSCKLDIAPPGVVPAFSATLIPNPAAESVELKLSRDIGAGYIRILDATGREVLLRSITSGGRLVFSVAQLPPGIYYYKFSDQERIHNASGRFIVR